jgi:hypothetical protein
VIVGSARRDWVASDWMWTKEPSPDLAGMGSFGRRWLDIKSTCSHATKMNDIQRAFIFGALFVVDRESMLTRNLHHRHPGAFTDGTIGSNPQHASAGLLQALAAITELG